MKRLPHLHRNCVRARIRRRKKMIAPRSIKRPQIGICLPTKCFTRTGRHSRFVRYNRAELYIEMGQFSTYKTQIRRIVCALSVNEVSDNTKAKEISIARNWKDVSVSEEEIIWCQSIFNFVAEVADVADAGEIERAQMIEMVVHAIATSALRFQPREELLNQVCADVRWALTAPDAGDESKPN